MLLVFELICVDYDLYYIRFTNRYIYKINSTVLKNNADSTFLSSEVRNHILNYSLSLDFFFFFFFFFDWHSVLSLFSVSDDFWSIAIRKQFLYCTIHKKGKLIQNLPSVLFLFFFFFLGKDSVLSVFSTSTNFSSISIRDRKETLIFSSLFRNTK